MHERLLDLRPQAPHLKVEEGRDGEDQTEGREELTRLVAHLGDPVVVDVNVQSVAVQVWEGRVLGVVYALWVGDGLLIDRECEGP